MRPSASWRGALAFASAATLLFLSGGRRASDAAGASAAAPAGGHRASGEAWGRESLPATTLATAPHGDRSPSDIELGRAILARHCGTCHTPGLPTSSPGALEIFSLADEDWSAHMTPDQICASRRRINGTVPRQSEEARQYAELVGRLIAVRGAPPCGT